MNSISQDGSAVSAMDSVSLRHVERSPLNQRWLVELADGGQVECVVYRGHTLCVSSQVGCAVACPFCASGARGLARPLSLTEMIGQVEAVRALGYGFERVTVSGVGDPLHNHDVVRAFVAYCHRAGLGPSLTTSGGPLPRLREWLHAPHNGLTLSVHAGTEGVRARMVPKGPPLAALFAVLTEEHARMTQRRRRKTALAYLMIDGMNDGEAEVDAFIERVRPLGLTIHLYAYNPVPTSEFRRVSDDCYRETYRRMTAAGLRVRMSSQARIEGNGGCGTLVALHRKLHSAVG
jgi:23S rRNA (adenine2503-C2)-methyltransferase